MRLLIGIVLIGLSLAAAPAARADQEARADQIQAASADAMGALREQVEAVPLAERITIGTLIDQTRTRARLIQALQQARQLGGPRWLDAQTAQVRLEIDGEAIVDFVRAIVTEHAETAPVRLDQIEPALAALKDRRFTASGSSASASVLDDVRPAGADEAWAKVEPHVRRQAIAAARRHAVEQVIQSARTLTLPDGRAVGGLMDQPGSHIRPDMEQYLMQRPVTAVQFRDDLQVRVTLSAPPAETFQVLRRSIERSAGAPELDDAQWSALREAFAASVAPATGAGVLPQEVVTLPVQAIRLPEQPPLWVREMIDAVGSAEGAETRLKTRHAAELEAIAKLRQQVLELPLTPELKLGDAAERDPEIAAAVDRALARARAYKSDYFPDGRVIVRSSLDLADVWEQLQER